MTTLQEYLNQHYPDQRNRKWLIVAGPGGIENQETKEREESFWKHSGSPDRIIILPSEPGWKKEQLDLSVFPNIKIISLFGDDLTSIDFLNTHPNPEKLERLIIYNNNIQPTNISVFSKFVNLTELKIGTMAIDIKEGTKHNRFYGSLKSYQPLTKLKSICIEACDIGEGLEYLPMSLVKPYLSISARLFPQIGINERYSHLECSPHGLDVGCKYIKNQLKKFDYDIEAWQLAHPHLMYKSYPEYFQQPETRDKWYNATLAKIEQAQNKLSTEKGEKKIKRLKSKIRELTLIKTLIEERSVFEDSLTQGVRWYDKFKEDKSTQTEPAKTQDKETQTEELVEYKIPGSWPSKK
jgi:hypothetical protein